MNKISIYFNDNTYQVITNKISSFTSNYVLDSNIQDKNNFLKEFKENNKQNKFMSTIVPYNLDIYLNFPITEKDNFYYLDIFEELNFNKIKLKYITELLDSKTYLISNYNSLYIIYKNNTIKIYKYLLREFINKKYFKKLYLFGNNINNLDYSKIYIFSNYKNYIAKKVLDINKLEI